MSDTPNHGSNIQETPDWWMASDHRWYPPELHPDYMPPAAPTPPQPEAPSATPPAAAPPAAGAAPPTGAPAVADPDSPASLSERLRQATHEAAQDVPGADQLGDAAGSLADRVGDEAAAALPDSAPGGPDAAPPTGPVSQETVIVTPDQLASAGGVPGPAMGAPIVPIAAPAPQGETIAGPAGITYTAAPDAAQPQYPAAGQPPAYQPGEPGQPGVPAGTAKRPSTVAGTIAVIGGAAAIAGSLLQWGKGAVTNAGVEKAVIEVAGFDSSGMITLIAGAALVVLGLLFFMGTPTQLHWSIAAFIAGGVIVGAVVFSVIDISDLSSRYAAEWQASGDVAAGDVVKTEPDIGLWIAGAGGVLGVLAAPFVNRS